MILPQIRDTKHETDGILCVRENISMITSYHNNTKQVREDAGHTNIFDLPEPFNPVIAVNDESQPLITVRLAYDLNPSITTSFSHIYL
jgi:hypothetical protein